MSEQNKVQQLLRDGIELAREGKKAEARAMFEQVVELDDKSEKGWFWLASVVETDDEKRVCLGNVLFINPNNERAQKLMAQLQEKDKKRQADEEVIPGVTRRQLTLFGGGGAVVIIVILLIFLLITSSRNASIAQETQVAQAAIDLATKTVLDAAATATSAYETQVALASPTPTITPTSDRPTEVPSWTPTSTATSAVTATPLPFPNGLNGRILGWSGRDTSQIGFLSIGIFSMTNGQFQPISQNPGRHPGFGPNFEKVIYTRYFTTTSDFGLEQINANGSELEQVGQGLPVIKPQMPHYCSTSRIFTFVAVPTDSRDIQFGSGENAILHYQVYTFSFETGELLRMTNDDATYSFPAYSPDCQRIAVVRDDIGGNPGADIVLIDATSRTQTPLTNDLGNFVESFPQWSPDGTQIIYSAASANSPQNGDIMIRRADGLGAPVLPIPDENDANDVYPIFSPTGQYIAFSSNRSGYYDIYIFDQVSSILYQLTSSEDQDYPGGWSPS